MDKIYAIHIENDIAFASFNCEPEMADIMAAVDDFSHLTNLHLRVWDFSSVVLNFSNEELLEIADYSRAVHSFDYKSAIVVSNDLSFGLSRMYGAFRESSEAETRVYRSMAEAIEWLSQYRKTLR